MKTLAGLGIRREEARRHKAANAGQKLARVLVSSGYAETEAIGAWAVARTKRVKSETEPPPEPVEEPPR